MATTNGGDIRSEGLDVASITRVEEINQLVRAFCIFILLVTFCVAFLWGVYRGQPVVSIESFVGVLTFAMTWWFKSRDEQQRRTDMQPPTTTTKTPDTTFVTGPTPPRPAGGGG
jgi:hypothetical protein